jgi:hypothetical protein
VNVKGQRVKAEGECESAAPHCRKGHMCYLDGAMKNIVKNDEGRNEKAKAWSDFVELVREFTQRRNVRVVGQYIARKAPNADAITTTATR